MKQSNHSEHFENDVVNYRQKTGLLKSNSRKPAHTATIQQISKPRMIDKHRKLKPSNSLRWHEQTRLLLNYYIKSDF